MAETDDSSRFIKNADNQKNGTPRGSPGRKKQSINITANKHSNEDNSSESDSSETASISLPTPPDGEWGWVVVFASFMVHLIADGCAFSFGVLYVELLGFFNESKGKTALIGSLFVSVPLITGPLASAVTNRYGCRTSTMIGGFIAGFGFFISAFMNSVESLCFTFGIIAGLGLSLVYVPAVVIVAYYFEKRRSFATGLAVAGSGIGTFVFAPMTEYLMEEYTWRGAVIIIGGIMLNIMVCGAVFRPLETPKARRARLRRISNMQAADSNTHAFMNESSPHEPQAERLVDTRLLTLLEELDEPVAHSLVQFPTYLQSELSPDILQDIYANRTNLSDVIRDHDLLLKFYGTQSLSDVSSANNAPVISSDSVAREAEEGTSSSFQNNGMQNKGPHNGNVSEFVRKELVWRKHNRQQRFNRRRLSSGHLWPMSRKDIFYRGALWRDGMCGGTYKSCGRAVSCPDLTVKSETSSSSDEDERWAFQCLRFSKEVKHIIREMLDVNILRSAVFVYFSLSCMLLYMWYDVPYVYAPDMAINIGISETKASYLVSIIGITSTVGQIVIGYVGDRPKVNALHLYNALTTVAGVSTGVVPFFANYTGLSVLCGMFGFFISANYALTTIILVELLGMEKLTNAYGLVMLAQGISNLVGPPLAGWLSDVTGSYDATFYVAGVGIGLSGMMLLAIPWLYRCDGDNLSQNDKISISMKPRLKEVRYSVPEVLLVEQHESVV